MKDALWIRNEIKENEYRAPITPDDAKIIISLGHEVYLESSNYRIFHDDEYEQIGCHIVNPYEWADAPAKYYILGIKELPTNNEPIKHNHIYFSHSYKNKVFGLPLLDRFKKGGGQLYDLEYLEDSAGKRLASFSYWAGIAGASLSLLTWIKRCKTASSKFAIPEYFSNVEVLFEKLTDGLRNAPKPSGLVIGAKGKCGSGALSVLNKYNIVNTEWGTKETKDPVNNHLLFKNHLLFNCINLKGRIQPFITTNQLNSPGALSIITDISCDPESSYNPLPIYEKCTTLSNPSMPITSTKANIEIIAIDNLPSFLPKESSVDFSRQLLPHITELLSIGSRSESWNRAASYYYENACS